MTRSHNSKRNDDLVIIKRGMMTCLVCRDMYSPVVQKLQTNMQSGAKNNEIKTLIGLLNKFSNDTSNIPGWWSMPTSILKVKFTQYTAPTGSNKFRRGTTPARIDKSQKRRTRSNYVKRSSYTEVQVIILRKTKKATCQHTKATKNFDNATIVYRLRTFSWSNDNYLVGQKRLTGS